MRPETRTRIFLVTFSILFTFLLIDVGLRVKSYINSKKALDGMLMRNAEMPTSGEVSLGHIIKKSSAPRVFYELKPNIEAIFMGVKIRTNDMGFRSSINYPIEKSSNTVRIMGLGDSLMFGWGVKQDKDFMAIIEHSLNKLHPDRKWEAINTAVPAYNTAMEVAAFEAKGLQYKPDLVILGFVPNDFMTPGFIINNRDFLSMKKSFLLDFIKARLNILKHSTNQTNNKKTDTMLDDSNGPDQNREVYSYPSVMNSLERLSELRTEYNFKVLIFLFSQTNWNDAFSIHITKKTEELGFELLDLRKFFMAWGAQFIGQDDFDEIVDSLFVSKTDDHPSEKAHLMAADQIYRYLLRSGFINSSPQGIIQQSDNK